MSPRPAHPGRPGTPVIPAGWEAAHRPVAAATRRGTVEIRHPGALSEDWSDELQRNVVTPHPPFYADTARIQALAGQANTTVVADDQETVADYLVAVDAEVHEVQENDLVEVKSGDPALNGRTLVVVQVARGTERFERDLFCTLTD